MKKRDRPLVGDSPARFRVPIVGTVSLGGVVANGEWPVRHSPWEAVCGASSRSIPGQAPSCIGHGSPPDRSQGKRGGSPQGERAGDPRAGFYRAEGAARVSRRRKAARPGVWSASSPLSPTLRGGWWRRRPCVRAGRLSRSVALRPAPWKGQTSWQNPAPSPQSHARRLHRVALRVSGVCYDYVGPAPNPDRGQAFSRGRRSRRLRRDTTLPGRQRIPRTATTSSVPSPRGTSAAALPVPWQ